MASIRCEITYNATYGRVDFDWYIGYETPMRSGYDGYRQVRTLVDIDERITTLGQNQTTHTENRSIYANPGQSIHYYGSIEYKNASGSQSDRFYIDHSIDAYYTVPSSSGTSSGGAIDPGGGGSGGGGGTVTPGTPYSPHGTINEFSWTELQENYRAYQAITYNGATSEFSWNVWNRIVQKVLQLKQAWGVRWDETYSSYSNTLMTPSDKVLTARRFNSLSHNIQTNWFYVNTGDPVMGFYFINLVDALNNGIRAYNNS